MTLPLQRMLVDKKTNCDHDSHKIHHSELK